MRIEAVKRSGSTDSSLTGQWVADRSRCRRGLDRIRAGPGCEVVLGQNGAILVDRWLRISARNIWAIGAAYMFDLAPIFWRCLSMGSLRA